MNSYVNGVLHTCGGGIIHVNADRLNPFRCAKCGAAAPSIQELMNTVVEITE